MGDVRGFDGHFPRLDGLAYLDKTAVVIGDVSVGKDSSIWPMAVLRGDVNRIEVGERSNIQDGSVLHVTHDGPYSPAGHALRVGDDVTVGHAAILHGCVVESGCLIGMRATVMDGAVVEEGSMIAAGALVTPGARVSAGWLWKGVPARPARQLTEDERARLLYSAEHYVRLARRHDAAD